MQRGEWVSRVRSDPKEQMESDLIIAAAGLVVIVMGSLVAVAGRHFSVQPIHDNTPAPLAGNIIAAVGALMILLGLVLAAANIVIWIVGRHRGDQIRPNPDSEALLQSIRDEGRQDHPSDLHLGTGGQGRPWYGSFVRRASAVAFSRSLRSFLPGAVRANS